MFILIFSLIGAGSFDIKPVRDSTVQQIKEARWEAAIANANIVLAHPPEDYLILGLLEFGHVNKYISKLNPYFDNLLHEKKSTIIKEWEKFSKANPANKNIWRVLAILYLDIDAKKTELYANKILESDSLNSFAYFLLGYASEEDTNHTQAIKYYRKSYLLDTTFTDCLALLANVYLLTGDYDSVISCFKKLPFGDSVYNSARIGEIVCLLKEKRYSEADSMIAEINNLEVLSVTRIDLGKLRNYAVSAQRGSFSASDSLIVLVPVILTRVNIYVRSLIVLLTTDEIKIAAGLTMSLKPGTIKYYPYDTHPKLIHIPPLKYPENERKAHHEGQVFVMVLIDVDGSIREAVIEYASGYEELDNEALRVARQAKFEPAKLFGKPVMVWAGIPVTFRLSKR